MLLVKPATTDLIGWLEMRRHAVPGATVLPSTDEWLAALRAGILDGWGSTIRGLTARSTARDLLFLVAEEAVCVADAATALRLCAAASKCLSPTAAQWRIALRLAQGCHSRTEFAARVYREAAARRWIGVNDTDRLATLAAVGGHTQRGERFALRYPEPLPVPETAAALLTNARVRRQRGCTRIDEALKQYRESPKERENLRQEEAGKKAKEKASGRAEAESAGAPTLPTMADTRTSERQPIGRILAEESIKWPPPTEQELSVDLPRDKGEELSPLEPLSPSPEEYAPRHGLSPQAIPHNPSHEISSSASDRWKEQEHDPPSDPTSYPRGQRLTFRQWVIRGKNTLAERLRFGKK